MLELNASGKNQLTGFTELEPLLVDGDLAAIAATAPAPAPMAAAALAAAEGETFLGASSSLSSSGCSISRFLASRAASEAAGAGVGVGSDFCSSFGGGVEVVGDLATGGVCETGVCEAGVRETGVCEADVVAAGAAALMGEEAIGALLADEARVSRSTTLGRAVLPPSQSAAVRADSAELAGGKMLQK